MPRKKITGGVSSAFRQVQQRAGALLLSLRNEIRAKEADLRRLRDGVSSLERLAGRAVATRPADGGSRRSTGGGRVNWSAILEQLPKQFKAADVRGIRGGQHKRASAVFAAIP